jgi:hypothetical protein
VLLTLCTTRGYRVRRLQRQVDDLEYERDKLEAKTRALQRKLATVDPSLRGIHDSIDPRGAAYIMYDKRFRRRVRPFITLAPPITLQPKQYLSKTSGSSSNSSNSAVPHEMRGADRSNSSGHTRCMSARNEQTDPLRRKCHMGEVRRLGSLTLQPKQYLSKTSGSSSNSSNSAVPHEMRGADRWSVLECGVASALLILH